MLVNTSERIKEEARSASDEIYTKVFDRMPNSIPIPRSILSLRGTKNGVVTIVGLYAEERAYGGKWIGQCSCGSYVIRK